MRPYLAWLVTLVAFTVNASAASAPPEFSTPQQRLFYYAGENDPAGIREALAEGAQLEQTTEIWGGRPVTALYFAALLNSPGSVQELLNAGASVKGVSNGRPMDAAAQNGYLDILKQLYPTVQKLPAEDRSFLSRSALKASLSHYDCFRYLVESGANDEANYISKDTESTTLAGAIIMDDLDFLKYLVEEMGVDLRKGGFGPRPAYAAAWHGRPDMLRYALEHGADPDAGYDHWTPLGIAARYGHEECVEILLEANAKPVVNGSHFATQADLGGRERILEKLEALGLESKLWETWQEKQRPQRLRFDRAMEYETGLGAILLEGDWPEPLPLQEAEDSIRLAVLADESGQGLADLIIADLSSQTSIIMVERQALDAALQEHLLERAALVSGEGLGSLAQLLEADAIILVSKIEVDGDSLLQVRLLDTRKGLVMNIRYLPKKSEALPEFAERYAVYVASAAQRLRKPTAGLTPVSLINVRADSNAYEAEQAAKQTRAALEYALANTPRLLLLERESLDTLLQENQLAGRLGLDIQASAIQVDARVDWDSSQQKVSRLVLRVYRAGQEDVVSFEVDDRNDMLSLIQAAAEAISGDAIISAAAESTIVADREVLITEAIWLRKYQLYPEALNAMQSAIALGAERPQDWRLYAEIIRLAVKKLLGRMSVYDDATNHQILALESEYLRALTNFMRQLEVQPDLKLPYTNFDSSMGVSDFCHTLAEFNNVTLQRRHRKELAELERRYVNLLEHYLIPFVVENLPQDREAKKRIQRNTATHLTFMMMELMCSLTYLNQQTPETLEPLAAALLPLNHTANRFSFHMTEPRALPGGWKLMDHWVQQYAYPKTVVDYYEYRLKGWHNNSFPGNQPMPPVALREECVQYLSRSNHPYLQTNAELFTQPDHPGGKGYFIDGVEYSPRPTRHVYASETPMRIERMHTPDAQKYYDLESIRKAIALYEAAGEHEKFDQAIIKLNARLDQLTPDGPAVIDFPTVNLRYWHQRQFLQHLENSTADTPIYRRKDHTWYISIRYYNKPKKEYEIYIFRIDEHTGETQWDHYKMPNVPTQVKGWGNLLVTDQHYVLSDSSGEQPSFIIINRESGEITLNDDYMAYSNGMEDAISVGESIFFLAQENETNANKLIRNWAANARFMRLDLKTGELETIFNCRRNPPETPLDKPIGKRNFRWYLTEDQDKFLFRHGKYYTYDIATKEIQKITQEDYDRLRKVARTHSYDQNMALLNHASPWQYMRFIRSVREAAPEASGDGFNWFYTTDRKNYRPVQIEVTHQPNDALQAIEINELIASRNIKHVGFGEQMDFYQFNGGKVRGFLIAPIGELTRALAESPVFHKP